MLKSALRFAVVLLLLVLCAEFSQAQGAAASAAQYNCRANATN